MQNLARFQTTSKLGGEYLRNRWRYSKSDFYSVYRDSFWNFTPPNFPPVGIRAPGGLMLGFAPNFCYIVKMQHTLWN